MKAQSHNIPQRFQHIGNGAYYINFNIKEDMMESPDGDPVEVYVYDYVRVDRLTRSNIIAAIVRDQFSQDKVEAIQNNYINGDDVIEFLRLQAWREYAKLIADDAEQGVIDALVAKKVFAIAIPLNITMPAGDYSQMADVMLRLQVPYFVKQAENLATIYPSWISSEDRTLLDADPRVTINEIELFIH